MDVQSPCRSTLHVLRGIGSYKMEKKGKNRGIIRSASFRTDTRRLTGAASAPSLKDAKQKPVMTQKVKNSSAPIAISSRTPALQRNPSGQRWAVSGRDFITTVTVPSTGLAAGQAIVSQIISPQEFSSTRLSILSELYDNWEIKRLKFIYEPAVATTTAGQICGYIDRDSTDAFLSISQENIRKAASHPTFSANSVWSPNTWTINSLKDLTVLYTDRSSDPHWSTAGLFQLLAVTPIAAAPGPAAFSLGTLYLDYEIMFSSPQLENPSIINGGSMVTGAGTLTTAHPFGSSPTSDYNGIGFALPESRNYIDLEAGSYQITFQMGFSSSSHADSTVSAVSADGKTAITALSYDSHFDDTYNYINISTWQYLDSAFRITFTQTTYNPTSSHVWINPIPARIVSELSNILFPSMFGKTLQSRSWLEELKAVPWKVPARLVKMGLDYMDRKGWTGRLSPVSRGFSKLIGWLLEHQMLGITEEDGIPSALQEFWRDSGFLNIRLMESKVMSDYVRVGTEESIRTKRQ